MKHRIIVLVILIISVACQSPSKKTSDDSNKTAISLDANPITLDLEQANKLAQLPLDCIQKPLPYKSGIVIDKASDLAMPQEHHPAFYGCFDWHSAVHGHWSLVYLLKRFPTLQDAEKARKMLKENITSEHIKTEIEYFKLNRYTKSFERTYGWAWLLKLQEELYTWDDPMAQDLYKILDPLAQLISNKYQEYLPKLVYPIRVGEHTNTAFGLSFAYDYAITVKDQVFVETISERALEFYLNDHQCPMVWEPSGYDFLSPCLQEIDIMRKVLDKASFQEWFLDFLTPESKQSMEPAIVKDRSDGKLVHLDGLNFSRAWCLYPLQDADPELRNIADQHLQFSIKKIYDDDYSGGHWLASFALYAFKTMETVDSIN